MASRGANSAGVKQLLEAEKKAAEHVEAARKAKVALLKQAKVEADAEIAKFRAEKEAEFHKRAHSDVGTSNDDTSKINKDTEQKLVALKANFQKNEDQVIDTLINIVTDVKQVVHENYVKPQA